MKDASNTDSQQVSPPMKTPLRILVIDDDDIAFLIIKRCFYEAGLLPKWSVVQNVYEALHWLQMQPTPDLIFLEPMLTALQYNYETALRELDNAGIFAQTNVCIITNFLLDDFSNLGRGNRILKRFRKPFRKEYVSEILVSIQETI